MSPEQALGARRGRARTDRYRTRVTLALLACGLAGCVSVKPSQREYLSKPEMTPAADAHEDVWHSHIEAARHGAMGGHGGAGGGCGCG